MQPKRPHSVTITLFGVFFLGVLNAWRAFAITQQLSLSLALNIQPDPRIRLTITIVWALMFWGAAIALWLKQPWTHQAIPRLITAYALYDILLQAAFTNNDTSATTWLLRIAGYAVMILFATWALGKPRTAS